MVLLILAMNNAIDHDVTTLAVNRFVFSINYYNKIIGLQREVVWP